MWVSPFDEMFAIKLAFILI
jgi:hypothetical protein